MDDLTLANDALRKNLDELELVNKYLGGNKVVIEALEKLRIKKVITSQETVKIADLGCGGGDTLRAIAVWAGKNGMRVELIGVDANQFMLDYASEKARDKKATITFKKIDIFSKDFEKEEYDVTICSLFCHHFTDEELISLFLQIKKQTKRAFIINDLHRHWFAYYSIKYITKLLNGSYLVQNDAPLSVLRAFTRSELEKLLQLSDIKSYELRWRWAFRYQLIAYFKKK
ncbi:MAG: methyltransferase domain-containing protein [Cytophagales bacterium]|nr:MAG: methyltransferase domain-containing protein [Cytophagales bacterium]